jgi:hypothetical protein
MEQVQEDDLRSLQIKLHNLEQDRDFYTRELKDLVNHSWFFYENDGLELLRQYDTETERYVNNVIETNNEIEEIQKRIDILNTN